MTAEVLTLADFRPKDVTANPPGNLWARMYADEATVTAFVRDRLPPEWTVEFNYEVTDWAASVVHGSDMEGWPMFLLTRTDDGVCFASLWPCGSNVACTLDSLETALGLIPSGIRKAAAGRRGAMDEPSDTLN